MDRKPPPDGGAAAWLRVAAYGACSLGTLGFHYSSGILYDCWLDDLGEDEAAIAPILGLCVGTLDGTALLTAGLYERFGPRRMCLFGGVLAAGGLAISAAATRAWHLWITMGLVVGVGQSLCLYAPAPVMLAWFDKRLGLAHSLGMGASGIAPFVLGSVAPQLLSALGVLARGSNTSRAGRPGQLLRSWPVSGQARGKPTCSASRRASWSCSAARPSSSRPRRCRSHRQRCR